MKGHSNHQAMQLAHMHCDQPARLHKTEVEQACVYAYTRASTMQCTYLTLQDWNWPLTGLGRPNELRARHPGAARTIGVGYSSYRFRTGHTSDCHQAQERTFCAAGVTAARACAQLAACPDVEFSPETCLVFSSLRL